MKATELSRICSGNLLSVPVRIKSQFHDNFIIVLFPSNVFKDEICLTLSLQIQLQ